MTFIICDVGSIIEYVNADPNEFPPPTMFSSTTFLGPNKDVYKLFEKDPYEIKHNLQIWRLVTPIMLHIGFSHLVFNMLTQIIFGSLLEQLIGFKHMAIIYVVSG